MQLLLGVSGSWKCVDVKLVDGCSPCIAGSTLTDLNIEPAIWYKVLVLDCICVDCSERVITWSVCDPRLALPAPEEVVSSPTQSDHYDGCTVTSLDSSSGTSPCVTHSPLHSLTSSLIPTVTSSLCKPVREHSLMAPHEGDSLSECTDDLQSLFELAQVLFRASSQANPRAQRVEQKSWFRLVHCYLLPLVTFSVDDLQCVQDVKKEHRETLAAVDQAMLDITTKTMQLKEALSTLRSTILPTVQEWAELGKYSHKFLDLLTSDLRTVEEQARRKIQASMMNLDVSDRLTTPLSGGLRSQLMTQCGEGEQLLSETLTLRAALHKIMTRGKGREAEGGEAKQRQDEYVRLHTELTTLRAKSSFFSKRKVLALSVREAIGQAVESLEREGTTGRQDLCMRGGRSTDVLPNVTQYQPTDEYLTLRDKVQKVLRQSGSQVAQCHVSFCSRLRQEWFPDFSDFVLVPRSHTLPPNNGRSQSELPRRWSLRQSPTTEKRTRPDLQQLSRTVKHHFEKMMDLMCAYYNNHDPQFVHRIWICYERVFFEIFSKDFISIYKTSQKKFSECLQLNSLSVSMLDPASLQLDVPSVDFLAMFPPRPFDLGIKLYREIADNLTGSPWQQSCSQEFIYNFGGMTSDLQSLPLANSPLEKLQLLTSAFRKCMASLSRLKLKPLLEECAESADLNQAAVSCDDLLPVLVLVLLQAHPSLITALHVDTVFLNDYIAPFLASGWHGYSLATFSSVVQIISQL